MVLECNANNNILGTQEVNSKLKNQNAKLKLKNKKH